MPPLDGFTVAHFLTVEFITEPKAKYGEKRCYIRDPDGYIIEIGESDAGILYG